MKKKVFKTLLATVLLIPYTALSQNLTPVILDEEFEEWSNITDIANISSSGNQVIKALNDDDFLYLYFEVAEIGSLQENERIVLYIDSDNDASTGEQVNGIGAEVSINFGTRNITVNLGGTTSTIGLFDLNAVVGPTVWSDKFEFAIERDTQVEGVDLFSGDEIKLIVEDKTTQLLSPAESGGASYTFGTNTFDALPTFSIAKADDMQIRFMSHNVLRDALFDDGPKESFARIYQAIDPEIIGFQEIYNHTPQEVADLMEEILPSEAGESWYGSNVHDNILISRFPIKGTYPANNDGNGAFLIDLSPKYKAEVLVVNAHTPCCDNDAGRTSEIDAMMAFIRDAKSGVGDLTLKENTPIVIMGDMNLVGNPQQTQTLLNGDIQDEDSWGEDFTTDWDGNDFKDSKPLVSGWPMTFTWRSDVGVGKFSRGRIDVIIYSGSGLTLENTYVMYTNSLSQDLLTQYSLEVGDSEGSSDHLPLVSDYTITVELTEEISLLNLRENDSDGIPKLIDQTVTVSGIVTADEEFGSSLAYLQDNVAGISIFGSEFSDLFTKGDLVDITANLKQFNGATQLQYDASSSSVIVQENTDLPSPTLVTINQIINQDWNGFELLEGKLVHLLNVTFTETGNFEGGTNYEISDGVNTLTLRIDVNTDLVSTAIPEGEVNIIGLVGQFDSSSPYSEGYQVFPRSSNDIGVAVGGILALRENDEDGISIYDGTEVTVSGIITVNDEFGANVAYIQDSDAGIAIYSTEFGDLFTKGDSISITAVVSEFNGSSQLNTASAVVHKSTQLPDPTTVTIAEILNQDWDGFELLEGKLVQISNVEFSTTGNFEASANYEISDGVDVLNLRIDANTDLVSTIIPEGLIDVIGIVGQFDASLPRSEGYQILPRNITDLGGSLEGIIALRENDENGVPVHDGKEVTVSGVITAYEEFGTNTAYIQDEEAAVTIFSTGLSGLFTKGDSIDVEATVAHFNGFTELINPTVIVHKSTEIPTSETVTIANILDQEWNGFELLEGKLVQILNVEFSATGNFEASSNYEISDGVNALNCRINGNTNMVSTAIPEGEVNITGIVSQFDTSSPYSEGYQILPRSIEDINEPVDGILKIRQNDQDGVSIYNESIVTVSGIVTTSNLFGDSGPAFMQDSFAGVAVFGSELVSQFDVGDSITITSAVDDYHGQTQLIYDETNSAIVVHKNVDIPEPKTVTIDDILNQEWNDFELLESVLVKIEEVEFAETGTFSANVDYTISDGTSDLIFRVNSQAEIVDQNIPEESINLIGLVRQYDNSIPKSEGYQLVSRTMADLGGEGEVTAIDNLNVLSLSTVQIFPNPTEGLFSVGFNVSKRQNVSISILDLSGRQIIPAESKIYEVGKQEVLLSTDNLQAGIYACRLNFESGSITKRLIVIE